jgi:hypothetical protein
MRVRRPLEPALATQASATYGTAQQWLLMRDTRRIDEVPRTKIPGAPAEHAPIVLLVHQSEERKTSTLPF